MATGWSPYSFSYNNPVSFNDPLGLEAEEANGVLARKKHGFTPDDPNNLANVTITGKHSTQNLINSYWFYRLHGGGLNNAPAGIQNWLNRYDRTERFMEQMHRDAREFDRNAAEFAMYFVPIPGLGEAKILGRLGGAALKLFRFKRGAVIGEKALITILGKYPNYLKAAEEMGFNKFSIPENIWGRMTEAEQWAANSGFLDEAVARGDEIIFSHRVQAIESETGVFKKELDYLIDKGYHLAGNGTKMIK